MWKLEESSAHSLMGFTVKCPEVKHVKLKRSAHNPDFFLMMEKNMCYDIDFNVITILFFPQNNMSDTHSRVLWFPQYNMLAFLLQYMSMTAEDTC